MSLLVSAGPSFFCELGGPALRKCGVTRRASSFRPLGGIGRKVGSRAGRGADQKLLGMDDRPGAPGGIGPAGQGMGGAKAQIPLGPHPIRQTDALDFAQRENAHFRAAETKIGEAKQGIAIIVEFGRKPCASAQRIEEFDDRGRIEPFVLRLAETTPGPLIMVTQFVGFLAAFRDSGTMPPLLAATLGAILTTWVTFVPCFLWIFAGAPFIERLRGNTALSAALTAITAAVVGVIFNLAIWFAIHTLFGQTMLVHSWTGTFDVPILRSVNPVAVVLALAAAIAIFRFRLGVLTVLGGCAALGAFYKLAL